MHIAAFSPSTVGRMLADLKKQGKLRNPKRLSLSGKSGRLIEKKPRKSKPKLRSKGYTGALAKADTNGSEFEDHFEMFCGKEGITHFFSYPRSPKMNAEVERFNRTLSEAFIQGHRLLLAYDLEAFNKALMDWLLWYNTRRPHWSIGLISPLRYIVNK